MWIPKSIRPLRKGYYKTLVNVDGYNLEETDNQLYNGTDWDVYESNSQFICYWLASKEDYETILEHLEEEKSKYLKQLEEESKNFGGF